MGITTVDFGARVRSLIYSGSYGYQVSRTSFHAFLFRVPFPLFMNAVEKAYPDITTADLLSRAHAQLCLDLYMKSRSKDPGFTTLKYFWESYRFYKKHYQPRAKGDPDAEALVKDFHRYRRYNGLGIDGQILLLSSAIKKQAKRLVLPLLRW
jgi:hypothetical protein